MRRCDHLGGVRERCRCGMGHLPRAGHHGHLGRCGRCRRNYNLDTRWTWFRADDASTYGRGTALRDRRPEGWRVGRWNADARTNQRLASRPAPTGCFKSQDKFFRRGVALRWLAVEHLEQDLFDGFLDGRIQVARPGHRCARHLHQHFQHRIRLVGHPTDEQLVGNDPQRISVGRRSGCPFDLLRGHIGGRADDEIAGQAFLAWRVGLHQARNAEVADDRPTLGVEQDVRRLEIAVDHWRHAGMRVIQRHGDWLQQLE